MSIAVVQLNVVAKRMLSKKEAAQHCGRSLKRFEIECSVKPIRFPNGDFRWDVKELDLWLDGMKEGKVDHISTMLARLK